MKFQCVLLLFCQLGFANQDCTVFWSDVHSGIIASCSSLPNQPEILKRNLVFLKIELDDCLPPTIARDFIGKITIANPRLSASNVELPICHGVDNVEATPAVEIFVGTTPALEILAPETTTAKIQSIEITTPIAQPLNDPSITATKQVKEIKVYTVITDLPRELMNEKTDSVDLEKCEVARRDLNSSYTSCLVDLAKKNRKVASCFDQKHSSQKDLNEVKSFLDVCKQNVILLEQRVMHVVTNLSKCTNQNVEILANLSDFYPRYKFLLSNRNELMLNFSGCLNKTQILGNQAEMQHDKLQNLALSTKKLNQSNIACHFNLAKIQKEISHLKKDGSEQTDLVISWKQKAENNKFRFTQAEASLSQCNDYTTKIAANITKFYAELNLLTSTNNFLRFNLTNCQEENKHFVAKLDFQQTAFAETTMEHSYELQSCFSEMSLVEVQLTECFTNLSIVADEFVQTLRKNRSMILDWQNATDFYQLRLHAMEMNLEICQNEIFNWTLETRNLSYQISLLRKRNKNLENRLECAQNQKSYYLNESNFWKMQWLQYNGSQLINNCSESGLPDTTAKYWNGIMIQLDWTKIADLILNAIAFCWAVATVVINPIAKIIDRNLQTSSLNQSRLQKSIHTFVDINLSEYISDFISNLVGHLISCLVSLICKKRGPLVTIDEGTITPQRGRAPMGGLFTETEMLEFSPILPAARVQAGPMHSTPEISADSTTLQFMKISERAQTPIRATEFAAGLDLFSAYDYTIHTRERILCKTDLCISIPKGCYARIAPRSGLSLNHGIDIGAGVIDPDYRGNVGVVLINFSEKSFYVKSGDRIAQLICERILYPRVIECKYLSSTVRDMQTEEKKKETPNSDVDFETMYEQEFEEKQSKEKEEISNNLIASEIFWLSKRGQTEAFRILFKDFLPFLQIGSFEYDRITTTFRPCRSSPWTNANNQFKSIAEIPLGDSRIFDLFKGKFEADFTRALQQAEDKKKEYENKLITQQQRYQQSRYNNKKYSSYN